MVIRKTQTPPDRPATDRRWIGVMVLVLLAVSGMVWLGSQCPEKPGWERARQEAQEILWQQQQARQAAHRQLMEEARQALLGADLSSEQLRQALAKLDAMPEENVRVFILRQRMQRAERAVQAARSSAEWDARVAQAAQARNELYRLLAEQQQRLEADRKAARHPVGKWDLGMLIGVSVVAAFLMTTPMELRHLRVIQLVLIPCLVVAMRYVVVPAYEVTHTDAADVVDFLGFLPVVGVFAVVLATNISYFCARMVEGMIDPHDWTPAEEELALAPVRRLIQDDRYREALQELEQLLARHKPSYEALLLKARLLNRFQQGQRARQTLLSMIRLTRNEQQQALVMQGLRELAGAAKP